MKFAVCFHGLVGSTNKGGLGKNLNLEESYKTFVKNVIECNKTHSFDIFVHSQSLKNKNEIIKLLKPKKYLIENQKMFKNYKSHPSFYTLNFYLKCIKNIFRIKQYLTKHNFRVFCAYSRWYTAYKVLEIMKNYEIEKKLKYDFIILIRMDLSFLNKIHLNNLKKNILYCSNWNEGPTPENNYKLNVKLNNLSLEKNRGLLDFWFIGDNDLINRFSKLYLRLKYYHIDNHTAAKQHADYLNLKINYMYFRFKDFEITRRLKNSED